MRAGFESGDALLVVRFRWPADTAALGRALGAAPDIVRVGTSLDGSEGYAWIDADAPAAHAELDASCASAPSVAHALGAAIAAATGAGSPIALVPLRAVDGASAGRPAPFRYVVETDVEAAHEADFNAWYDDEHLAGLAAVPGAVRAARYRDPSGAPRYHAIYDLERPETLGSPAWLAVRATPWSDRVRPRFVNTKRTMFRIRPRV